MLVTNVIIVNSCSIVLIYLYQSSHCLCSVHEVVLLGEKYNVQKGVRCANTGQIFVEKMKH